jgi:hypothetical protein
MVLKAEGSGVVAIPRLVERSAQHDGAVIEVFEVAPGELVTVESWSNEAPHRGADELVSGDRESVGSPAPRFGA